MSFPLKSFMVATIVAAPLLTGSAFATLIPIGVVPSTGGGLGSVNTVITFQNTGTEVGAVGLLPASGSTEVTGSTVAFGIPGFPSAAGATHETAGNAGSNLYSATSLGIVSGSSTTFSNMVLIFNGVEGGAAADQAITLENLALNLFSTSGSLLGSFTTASPYNAMAFPGVGNAGFGFQLDNAQATAANALLASNPTLIIGAAARASGANAGPETISISTLTGPPVTVPDTGSTLALLGLTLIGSAAVRRFLR